MISVASTQVPVAEAAQLHRRLAAHERHWSSHAGRRSTALPGTLTSAPPQHTPAAIFSAWPHPTSAACGRTALSPARGSQHTAGSRGLATAAGPQLLDSAGRPIASNRHSHDQDQLADNAELRPNDQWQAIEPRQDAAVEAASGYDAQPVVAIDRSGLRSLPGHEHEAQSHKGPETALLRHLKALIRVWTGYLVRQNGPFALVTPASVQCGTW